MTFEEFKAIVRAGIESGEVKVSEELTDLDLAVQYAIGQEMETCSGTPVDLSVEEIVRFVEKYCGEVEA